MTGLHKSIEYSFMVVGHTKFSCDRSFGVMKKKLNCMPLWNLYDIATAVDASGECNFAKLVGQHDGTVLEKTFDWVELLSRFFKKLENITDYYHFHFDSKEEGTVTCFIELDGEPNKVNLLKKNVVFDRQSKPREIVPEGFSIHRQKYLFKEICQFCKSETADLVAPEPADHNKRPRLHEQ